MGLRQKGKRDQGFTLIEVVVAITLAGLVTASIAGLFAQSAFTQHNVNQRVTALIIGAGKLAEIEYNSEQGSSGNFPAPYQSFNWFVYEETGDNDVKTLILTVEWKEGKGDQPRQVILRDYRRP
ncbi:MAG TPA: prepilin-type N-terminal cleavage/methylation domain-containing protein [Bacillota bacterium]|nr:prepilin-type N-terminal cleavage/methylation domain-containing protein [Bacillota bacterium]